MDLTRFYRMVKKSWILILSLSLIGAAAGAVVSYLTPAQYTSTTRLFVAVEAPATANAGDLVQANNFAIQKVFSYVNVVTTNAVLEPVVEQLGLTVTADDLAKDVAASVPTNSVVLSISATAANPEDAATLATAVANSFSNYVVNTLESPLGGGPGPVKTVVLNPATPPLNPSSVSAVISLALGAILGLFVGLLLCVFLTLRDKRVHTRRELDGLDVDYVGGVAELPKGAGEGFLVVRDDPQSSGAEAFRRLRTTLGLTSVEDSGAVGVMCSVGGEGTSTLVSNLALAFAEGSASVAVVDADVRFGRQRELIGRPSMALADALADARPGNVAIVAPGIVPQTGGLDREAFQRLLAELASRFDVVLVDAPPVLQTDDALIVANAVKRTLVVAASGRVDVAELSASLDALRSIHADVYGVAITRLPRSGADSDPAISVPLHRHDAR